eukprot:TRINITY_DN18213_c0_g3_i1.p1 TRINITY_DN18213_c0_g3~~TRINITY_DN18213_c0_g3_i1.p1  ORF type:complete len:700 (-),score=141.93 TRINITY_DN18213_c0_g3_i1:127-2202(-)
MAPPALILRGQEDSCASNMGDARSLAVLKLVDDVDELMRTHRGALDKAIEECLLGVLISHDDEISKPLPPPRASRNAGGWEVPRALEVDCVIEDFEQHIGKDSPVLPAPDRQPSKHLERKAKWQGLAGTAVVPISPKHSAAGFVAWQGSMDRGGEIKEQGESAALPPTLPTAAVAHINSDPLLLSGIVPGSPTRGPSKKLSGALKKVAAEVAETDRSARESLISSDKEDNNATAQEPAKRATFTALVKSAQATNRAANQATKLRRRASVGDGFASDAKKLEILASQNFFQRVTSSRYWEVGSVILILVNSLFIGIICQFMSTRAENDVAAGREVDTSEPSVFLGFEVIFNILFMVDLLMRWIAGGLIDFWRTDDVAWNLLDLVIVVIGSIDILFSLMADNLEIVNLSFVRVFRVVRVVRVARIIRVLKFFRELRMMVMSILASFKSLMWVIIILTMLFYVFGIIFTNGILSELPAVDMRRDNPELVEYYGTLFRAVLTLYMAMSGGNDWAEFYGCLSSMSGIYSFLFICYITFAILAVFNIVTGVFVESAMGASQADRDAIVQDEIAAQKAYLKAMEKLFEELDEDDSGTITLEELESRLRDPRVEAYFNALKLDVSDANIIFNLLDEDDSGELTREEFVEGCARLQGEARSLDTKIMQQEVRSVRRAVDKLTADLGIVKQATLGSRPLPQ